MVTASKIHRKLLRDIIASRAQFSAVALIITLGIATFVASYGAYQNLDSSFERSYERLRMADYWVSVDYVSQRAAKEINDISGVLAQGRIARDVTIDMEMETGEQVSGRVISLPPGQHPEINDVQIESGNYLSPGSEREILIEKRFAEFHNLHPGDWLTIKGEDYQARFKIAGTVVSPEYIWISKSAQELFSTSGTFGIIFMPQARAEALFAMKGLINEINLKLDPNTDSDEVFHEVGQVLRRYHINRLTSKDEPVAISTQKMDVIQGVRTAYVIERKDQLSNYLMKQEVEQYRQMAVLFPMFFLFTAALAVYILLSRLIESQRVQIGLMRALGYGKMQILIHYMGFALIMGVVGSVFGALLGHATANALTAMYASQLKLPFIITEPHWPAVGVGAIVGIGVPLFAGLLPSWKTARMRPAEAMRPPTPPTGHHTLLEAMLPFVSQLPSILKLPLRNTFRNMRRSFFMATGVASAVALILVSMSFVDLLDVFWLHFESAQNYDAKVIFQDMGTATTTSSIEHLQGIKEAEPVLELPYRLQSGERVSDSSIMGLVEGSSMYTLLTPEGSPTTVARDRVLLSLSLNSKLDAEIGDTLHMEPIVGYVGKTEKRLVGFIDEPLGGKAFMPLEEVQDMLRMPGAVTSVFVRFDSEPSATLLKRIYSLPGVTSIEFAGGMRQFFEDMMGLFWAFIGVMLAMGFALGMAIIFNGATINVLERRREIAIMRAVGMGRRRLGLILTLENLFIGILGIAIGLPIGYYIANYFMSQVSSEMMAMSAVIYPRSYVIACLSALVILLVSQIPAIRHVSRMSLPTVTKDWSG